MSNVLAPLSQQGCLEAVKRFTRLGLEYALVPLLSLSHSGSIWLREAPSGSHYLADIHNVCVRPSKFNTGVYKGLFVTAMDDTNMMIPLRETDTYRYLSSFGTLTFESGSTAAFYFQNDRFVRTAEHGANERVAVGPLKDARLVTESGIAGWGMLYDYDRSHRITCEGGPRHLRDLPELLDVLRKTGHLTLSGYNGGVFERGDVSGPPLV